MAASSSGVVRSMSSRAMRRASSQLRGPRAFVLSSLSLIPVLLLVGCTAKADDPDQAAVLVATFGEYQYMQPDSDEAGRHLTQLAIVFAVVDSWRRRFPFEPVCRGEI